MEDKKKKKSVTPGSDTSGRVDAEGVVSRPANATQDDWKVKAEEYLEGWKRAKADLENFEARSRAEQVENIKYANKKLVLEILPVLDNYDRAFDSLSDAEKENNWVKGFAYIKQQLETILINNGVVKFESKGQKFDPAHHESVAAVAGEKDVVVEEVVAGYQMGDKVIRHAKVKIGNGEVAK